MQLSQFSSLLGVTFLSLFNIRASCRPAKDASEYLQPDVSYRQLPYAPGWCGMHVIQYQKPNPVTDNYRLDIRIFDAAGFEIGQLYGADAPGGVGVGVTSALPYVLIATTGNIDDDAVLFAYAGQNWGSNDQEHHCNFGAYDSGSRQGDCGFTC